MYNLKNHDILFSNELDESPEFIPVLAEEDEDMLNKMLVPDVLPILALRNTVLFPGVVIPITVGRDKSLKLVKEVYAGNKILGAVSQINPQVEDPKGKDLFQFGTVGTILKILELPDGSHTVIIQGNKRFEIKSMVSESPYFKAEIAVLNDDLPFSPSTEFDAIVGSIKDLALRIIKLSPSIPPETAFAIKNIEGPRFLINYISSNTDLSHTEKQRLLELSDLKARGYALLQHLTREVQLLEIKNDIQLKVKLDLDQQQREYFLQQQIKTIQDELGGNPTEMEVQELRARAKKKKWEKDVLKVFEKEVSKLERMNPAAGEYSVQLNYVELLLDLPWNVVTKDNFDLKRAEKVLDDDHFGLEKVKERIIEHLAVLKLKGNLKSPILCLYGPPGVGKTSLGKSVARALGRKYGRISLGGLHDEAEIRGHRKTYIGAMPGRIIQTIKKVQSSNPVIILDEIDKVGKDFHGDPASALLEVLDPEQNNSFHDNYLDVDYDLSKVLFITTANNPATISSALRDRMEMIEVSGYILEEKIEIAKRHLLPKQMENHGLKKNQLVFDAGSLELLVDSYTRESGVRLMDKRIAKIVRSYARKVAFGEKYDKHVSKDDIKSILGIADYEKDSYQGNEFAGVVTGLAWTEVGGEILYVETSLSKGKGGLTLTGNLGDVMKESAVIAMEYIKAHAEALQLPSDIFERWNVHVHVPEGAIPKDGPSAGITMATSISSGFTQRKVRKDVAMTGEITLRGKVLPVGGIKEKILAAKRAGIKEIILSADNRKHIEDIKDIYLSGLSFHYVKTLQEVLDYALLPEKIDNPLNII
ncbi:endopeptidase La [Williamwhitmania taraxaci]|uniref:Lon protease n=1 Tax=Williamwhitmania taraxaci TaxID=1640674 RepID=A0A1G6LCK9_9BACT|nr:endopeptidase La [Williamwhitmania taraxaci]SDC41039.1 ATP-dependent Lon protease [Williamwhitmania taraxaci]